jgi:D-inositol-3-phosphate glycosyltransferase
VTGIRSLRAWVVDPISYTGMAYYDAGLCSALSSIGVDVTLVGSDEWLLEGKDLPFRRFDCFRGTQGSRPAWQKGAGYLVSLVRMLSAARATRPDVIHWNYLELAPADYVAQRMLRAWGIPQIYTAHELLPWDSKSYNRVVFERIFAVMDAIIVHNPQDADRLHAEFGVARDRIAVIVHGDYEMFATPNEPQASARNKVGLPADAPIALFFGSIRPSKGLEVLLDAWSRVVERVPGAVLAIVGKPFKGLDVSQYTSMASRAGLDDQVVFRFGQAGAEETNSYYRAADVVVLPYHDIVTSGVLRYAYSSARAVVATAVGEHSVWVQPGETGQLVPPRNPEALASAVAAMLADRRATERTGLQALAYGRRHFGWADIASRTASLYERVAAAGQIRRPRRSA